MEEKGRARELGWRVWLAVWGFRVVCALLVQTAFNPDEDWQGPEIAHHLVYGRGESTWEWRVSRIRSFLHPLVYAGPLWVARVLGVDSAWLVRWLPRLTQATMLTVTDMSVWGLGERCGQGLGAWSLALHLGSWFVAFSGVRPYANSVEAMLVGLALWQWPLEAGESGSAAWVFAGLACAMRPTAALALVGPGAWLLWREWRRGSEATAAAAGARAAMWVSLCVALGVAVDSVCYWHVNGERAWEWVWPAWEFWRLNVRQGLDRLYGVHAWHWYLSGGLWAVAPVGLPLALAGWWLGGGAWGGAERVSFWSVACAVAGLSFASHKEFRFLSPALAPLSVLAARGLRCVPELLAGAHFDRDVSLWRRRLLWAGVALNVALFAWFGTVFQRAPLAAMAWLRAESGGEVFVVADRSGAADNVHADTRNDVHSKQQGEWEELRALGAVRIRRVHFWTDCHATPFHAALHDETLDLLYLDCSPGARAPDGDVSKPRRDAAARFLQNPASFLANELYGSAASAANPGAAPPQPPTSHWSAPSAYAFTGTDEHLQSSQRREEDRWPRVRGLQTPQPLPDLVVADSGAFCALRRSPTVWNAHDGLLRAFEPVAWAFHDWDVRGLDTPLTLFRAWVTQSVDVCDAETTHGIHGLVFLRKSAQPPANHDATVLPVAR